jgi:hypothetical protein
MFTYNQAEIFEMIAKCEGNREEIKSVIKRNQTNILTNMLYYLFDPNIMMSISWIPEYTPLKARYGEQFIGFDKVFAKMNHYEMGRNSEYSEANKEKLLKRHLESLHANDAKLLEMIITRKKPKIAGLDESLVREMFPNLLTEGGTNLNEFMI